MKSELSEAMPRGYVAAFRWLGTRDEARDACQEAALRAWGARKSYDGKRAFYPWFYRILRNVCVDRLRVRGRSEALEQRRWQTMKGQPPEVLKPASLEMLVGKTGFDQLSPELLFQASPPVGLRMKKKQNRRRLT